MPVNLPEDIGKNIPIPKMYPPKQPEVIEKITIKGKLWKDLKPEDIVWNGDWRFCFRCGRTARVDGPHSCDYRVESMAKNMYERMIVSGNYQCLSYRDIKQKAQEAAFFYFDVDPQEEVDKALASVS